MGICPYCGKSVGFFARHHQACLDAANESRSIGIEKFKTEIATAFESKRPYRGLIDRLNQIKSEHILNSEIAGQTVLSMMDELSRHEPLEPPMAEFFAKLGESFVDVENIGPNSPLYDSCGPTFLNVALSQNLWLIMHNDSVHFPNPCDVILQTGENRLAEFGTVLYRKTVTVSAHAGGYNGISVRVASGLYYRFGGYDGRAVAATVQNVDTGFIVLTNKGMYFAGQEKTFRVPYSSILRFKAYPDGIGFFRNVGDGREELFTVVDPWRTLRIRPSSPLPDRFNVSDAVTMPVGWFLYNLVMFLTTPECAPSTHQVLQGLPRTESAENLGVEGAALRDSVAQPLRSEDQLQIGALIQKLGAKFQSRLEAARGSLTDEEVAKTTVETDFNGVIIHVLGCDGSITDREAQFYRAFQEQLKPGLFAKWTDSQMRAFIETLVKPGSPFTEPYQKPLTVVRLETYDARNGTNLSAQARDFLIRLATATASAAGPQSSRRMATLESVKAALRPK